MIPLLFIAFLLFLIVISILKTNSLSPALFNSLQQIPHHDKLGHFILMGTLAYLAIAAISPWLKLKEKSVTHPEIIIGCGVSILIILEEISQSLFPTRSCSWLDAIASIAGVCSAILIHTTITRMRCRRAQNPAL